MEISPMRPSEALIKNAYDQLLNSSLSLAKIRDNALADRLLTSQGNTSVIGRSITWKLFLTSEEPLSPSSSPVKSSSLLHSLRSSRQDYVRRLQEHMRAPDGSYEEGFVLPGSSVPLGTKQPTSREGGANLETNNPLSLHAGNPWKAWFTAVDLRKTISQDVERTFPEIAFFREPETQMQLTNILFLYSVMNPHIGYRQGMHEILAPLYYAVDFDSLPPDGSTGGTDIQEICSRTWVAADACALFDSVMRGLSRWYEWREPLPTTMSRHFVPPFATQFNFNAPDGPMDTKPYTAPIVEVCNRIQSTYLRTTDPLLYRHMQSAGVEPQIYGIRWLRLLFTREFNMADSMKLWDGLFACDPTLDLASWVCVAMLIRIRNELIPADYSGQLTALLRYPSPRSPPSFDDAPHQSSLLLRQALALQMSPTPSTGASIILENRNMLNIPIEVPSPTTAPQHRRTQNRNASPSQGTVTPPIQHSRQATAPQMGISEMIARGIMERGESLGINKSLMNAVSELRRNIPDLAASLVRAPNVSSSMFPLTDERPPEERPPWEPRSRFEMERESSSLRATNKRLGEALGWIVDVLLQDETDVKKLQRLKKQKQEALESLSYVRDVLLGNVGQIEEERLLGEEELRKRNSFNARTTQAQMPCIEAAVPPPPAAHSRPSAQPGVRNVASPEAMISPNTFGTARIAGTPISGLNGVPPWNGSQSRFSSINSSVGTPLVTPRAVERKGDIIEDPLGVGLG